MSVIPPSEKERRRRERDRILDLLEEEERLQQLQEERDAEEERKEAIRKRKESAKAELEQLKAAKEFQKKMGKALIRNFADAREKEEKEKVKVEEASLKPEPVTSAPKKSVTFADVPAEDDDEEEGGSLKPQVDWGDVAAGRLRSSNRVPLVSAAEANNYPMKMQVVERRPATTATLPTFQNGADSDDESPAPSEHSSPRIEPPFLEEEEESGIEQASSSDEDGTSDDEEPLEEEYDWDSAQHHREIALAYYNTRHAIGAETAKAMTAHAHNDDDDESQELLGTPVSGQSGVKPPLSRFRADRMAAAYDVSRAPISTSIGPSVIPASRQKSLRNSIRVGKLENDQLVGGEAGDSGSEDDVVREVLEMLKNGQIENAGPGFDPSSLTGGGPPFNPEAEPTSPTDASLASPTPAPAPAPAPRMSRFKMARGGGTAETVIPASGSSTAQPKPAISGVVERKPARQLPTQTFVPNKPARRPPTEPKLPDATSLAPSMIIDSPSFPMAATPSGLSNVVASPSFPAPSMNVNSPSFPRAQPVPPRQDMRLSTRPQGPPVVMSPAVKESSGRSQRDVTPPQGEAALKKPMSRFMAERQ
ncbi:hypothetical protein HYDPIDRAFT_105634 [Hydnomerulius pinastri MD-312]|nr:hypothetical protein HYDPIDRAFT_105634 [Hydnomerulius pinastri MD-312]